MKDAANAADMTEAGTFLVKAAMFVVPGVLIAASYLVYRRFYVLDESRYASILEELRARKEEHAGA